MKTKLHGADEFLLIFFFFLPAHLVIETVRYLRRQRHEAVDERVLWDILPEELERADYPTGCKRGRDA